MRLAVLIMLITHAFSTYRISYSRQTSETVEEMLVLSNNLLAVGFGSIVEMLEGESYDKSNQILQLNDPVGNSFMSQSGPSLLYLSDGGIQMVQKKSGDKRVSLSYSESMSSVQCELKTQGINVMIPPKDVSGSVFSINTANLSLQLYQPSNWFYYARVAQSSNFVFSANGSFYLFLVPYVDLVFSFSGGFFYRGQPNSPILANIFNLSEYDLDLIDTYPSKRRGDNSQMNRILAKLELIEQQKEKTFFLSWQSEYSNCYMISVMKQTDGIMESYSTTLIKYLQSTQMIDKDNVLVYEYRYCQVEMYNPNNAWSLRQKKQGLGLYLSVTTISKNQQMLVGLVTNFTINKFCKVAKIFKFNAGQFELQQVLSNSSAETIAFGSSIFIGNDEYLGILELRDQLGYPQLSLYSMRSSSFIANIKIINVYNYEREGFFCASESTFQLFIVTSSNNQLFLNYYQLDSEGLVLKDSLLIDNTYYTRISNLTCVGENEIIWSTFDEFKYRFKLTKYQIQENEKLKEVVSVEKSDLQDDYSLRAVVNGILVILPTYVLDFSSEGKFFNTDLDQISVSLVGKSYKGNFLIVDSRNDRMLIRSSLGYDVWISAGTSFTYSGSIPLYGNQMKSLLFVDTILLPEINILYTQYSQKSIYFKLDQLAKKSLGQIYLNNKCSYPTLTKSKMATLEGKNYIIYYHSTLSIISRYQVDKQVILEETIALNLNIRQMRLSSDKKWVIYWGWNNEKKVQYIFIRSLIKLSVIEHQRLFYELSISFDIQDADYLQSKKEIVITFRGVSNVVTTFIYSNNEKKIENSPSLKKINLLSTGSSIGAYSGIDSISGLQANYFVFHPIEDVSQAKIVAVNCKIKLLAISPKEKLIGVGCEDNTITIYIVAEDLTKIIELPGQINKISFLSETALIVNVDNKIEIISISVDHKQNFIQLSEANTSIAIDYQNQLIAYSSNSTNIIIADFNHQIIDQALLPFNQRVVALAFNQRKQLIVSTDGPGLMIWTTLPCSQNQTLSNSFCICKPTFIPQKDQCVCPNNLEIINQQCSCRQTFINVDSVCKCPNNLIESQGICTCLSPFILKDLKCVCPDYLVEIGSSCGCKQSYVLTDGHCTCDEGYVQQSDRCNSCSFLCDQCDSSSFVDCSSFGVWFFVGLALLVIIVSGITTFTILKIRKIRKQKVSQFSDPNSSSSAQVQPKAKFLID